MVRITTVFVKFVVSLILSGSILAGFIALVGFFDPTFSIGLFDLLEHGSFTTWLLLALATVIVFAILSRLPVGSESGDHDKPDDS